jgi:hypothetical protein
MNKLNQRSQMNSLGPDWLGSGTETSRLNQSNLVATGREFAALVALHDNPTSRLDTDHAGPDPAKGCGLQHFHHITGL